MKKRTLFEIDSLPPTNIHHQDQSKMKTTGKSLLPPKKSKMNHPESQLLTTPSISTTNNHNNCATTTTTTNISSKLRITKKPTTTSVLAVAVEDDSLETEERILPPQSPKRESSSTTSSSSKNNSQKENHSNIEKYTPSHNQMHPQLLLHPLIPKPSFIIKESTTGVQVQFFERFLHSHFTSILYKKFLDSIDLFTKDQLVLHGKHIEAPRKTLSYSNSNIIYSYSGMRRDSIPWFPELFQLKSLIETKTSEMFNYALVNLYENGNDYIGWHSDKTRDLVENSSIVSITLGETRPFQFRPVSSSSSHDKGANSSDKCIITKYLPNGSMVLMNWQTQKFYKHCLPKRKNISKPRINITFRNVKTTQQ